MSINISMYNVTSRYRDASHNTNRYRVTIAAIKEEKHELAIAYSVSKTVTIAYRDTTEIVTLPSYPKPWIYPSNTPKSTPKNCAARHLSYRYKSLSTHLVST